MSPKGRKSVNRSWTNCEECGVIISTKDLSLHCGQCPPDPERWDHAFLKDNIIHTFIEVSDVNDEPKVDIQRKNLFVYMSQSAMQISHFKIGEQVTLVFNNGDTVLRTVWPSTEKSLTSVVVPSNSHISQTCLDKNSRVKVMKVNHKAMPASKIVFSFNLKLNSKEVNQLINVCKRLYVGLVIKSGTNLNVPFYGKNITLYIKEIVPVQIDREQSLIENFEMLNINTDRSNNQHYIACEETTWSVFKKTPSGDTDDQKLSSGVTLDKVGGYKTLIAEIISLVSLALQNNKTYLSTVGILLSGPNGVGKTYVVEAIANEMNVPLVKINSGELFSKFYGETEVRLRDLFKEAKDQSPSILLLDNVDTLCPKKGGTEQERRVVAYLLTLLDSLKHSKVVVLATTSQIHLIDTALRRPGRLDYEIEFPVPLVSDRLEILQVWLKQFSINIDNLREIAESAHGFVAADLQCLVMKSSMRSLSSGRDNVTSDDLTWALSQIKPSAMREVLVHVPNVKWTDIGGMDDLKLKLQQAIEWPLRYPESFTRLGIKPPRGVLMYGPPGCSKTMIAKALATESKLNFLSIKGSELFSKWVGESEKAVQSLFKKARSVAPSIVFLDELDALGGERSGGNEGSNVQERVLAQLLTEMDGVEPLGNVNIIAATNRPDRIDKALLRPGRLDRMVYVPLPDLSTRSSILRLHLAKMPAAADVTVDELAGKTEGYSGAEVVAVCHEAAMSALQEDINAASVTSEHFAMALKSLKPRTPSYLIELYESYQKT